jgi:hypothetical protein
VEKGAPKSHTIAPGIPPTGPVAWGSELIRLRRGAPLRPPDWRARLASAIARHPDRRVVKTLSAWADDAVRELVRLGQRPLNGDHPLTEARSLLRPGQRPLRIEVEARLLAGQPPVVIDTLTGLGKGTAEWYHTAYYHCGDRLDAAGFIRHLFLGAEPQPDCRGGPPLEWARWYAYYAGVAVLETVLDVFRHWDTDRRPLRGGTADELARRARRLYARASVLARSITVENLSRAELRTLLIIAADHRGAAPPRRPRDAEHPDRRYTSPSGATGRQA